MFQNHWKPDEDIALIAQAFGTHEVSGVLGVPDYDVVKGMILSVEKSASELGDALEEGDIARVYASLYFSISNAIRISQSCGMDMGIVWDQCVESDVSFRAENGRGASKEELVESIIELIGG